MRDKIIEKKLDLIIRTQVAHGRVISWIANEVNKLTPGIDPELAAALGESKAHHEALKVALDAANEPSAS